MPVQKCGSHRCGHLFASAPAGDGIEEHPDFDREWRAFAERDARLVEYWLHAGIIDTSSQVLDFGAGSGHVAAAVERRVGAGRVTCIEADPETAEGLRARGLRAVEALDQADGPFDTALLIETIEHLVDPVAVLSELARLLRSGGALFVTTPCGETRRGSHDTTAYDNPAHVQFFTERSLALALRLAGFGDPDLRVIDALYPREPGLRVVGSWAKTLGRSVRAWAVGPTHLTGVARAGAPRGAG